MTLQYKSLFSLSLSFFNMCLRVCVSCAIVSNSFQEIFWRRNRTQVSCIAGRFFTVWATEEAYIYIYSLEKVMATHSSILAWKSPWTEEPGRIQSQGSLCQVLQVCRSSIVLVAQSCLALCNPMDCSLPGSFVHGILQSRILFPPPGDLPNQRIKPRSPALDSYYWTARKALCFDINFKISTFS